MRDPRIERLAELLIDYSLALEPGKMLRIEALGAAAPLVLALHRVAIDPGVVVYHTSEPVPKARANLARKPSPTE